MTVNTATSTSTVVPIYSYHRIGYDGSLVHYYSRDANLPDTSYKSDGVAFYAFDSCAPGLVPIYEYIIYDSKRCPVFYYSADPETPPDFNKQGEVFWTDPNKEGETSIPVYLYVARMDDDTQTYRYSTLYDPKDINCSFAFHTQPPVPFKVGDLALGGFIFQVDKSGFSGYVVSKADQGIFDFFEAHSSCYASSTGGYDDWGMPSREDLAAIYQYRLDIGGFDLFQTPKYWTSTEQGPYGYYLNFNDGKISYSSKTSMYGVRAIRKFGK